jgi:SAM-dependent methyltransferase
MATVEKIRFRHPADWFVESLARRRYDEVRRHVRGRLLDIGCGENRLVRAHGNGVGVDVAQWGDVDLVVKDAAHLPIEAASFDTITFIACLNHIPNREEVLEEARRVIRPDGRLIATMITPRISEVWHYLIRPWDPDQCGRHLHEGEVWGISKQEMRRLLSRHGFEVVRHDQFIMGMNNLYVAAPK